VHSRVQGPGERDRARKVRRGIEARYSIDRDRLRELLARRLRDSRRGREQRYREPRRYRKVSSINLFRNAAAKVRER